MKHGGLAGGLYLSASRLRSSGMWTLKLEVARRAADASNHKHGDAGKHKPVTGTTLLPKESMHAGVCSSAPSEDPRVGSTNR